MDAFADGLVWGLAAFWFTDRVLVWLDQGDIKRRSKLDDPVDVLNRLVDGATQQMQ